MSFTVTQRSSVNSGTTGVGSQATASFTPAANSRLFVFAYAHRNNNTDTRSWAISDTLSSTWTKLDETALFAWQTLPEYAIGAVAYYTDIGASPAAMTVTVDASAGSEFYGVIAFDVTGYDTGAPFPQSSVDNGAAVDPSSDTASGTLTLGSAPTNGNLVVAMFASGAFSGGGFAIPSGYTALTNQNQAYSQAAVFYRTDTTTAAVTCNDLGQEVGNWAGIVFEMKLAATQLEQEGFRWRNDDGSESAATWAAAQDNNVSVAALTNIRLRVLINATGNPDTTPYQLEYRKQGDTTWKKVLNAS